MKIFNKEDKDYVLLKKFLKKLGFDSDFLDDKGILIKKSKNIYLVKQELFDKIKDMNNDFFFAGTLIGEIRKSFFGSPELIDMLSKHSNKKVVVNKKSEWMFLCGKDIFKKGILENTTNSEGFVFVQTENDENLGLAEFSRKNQGYLLNRVDKGAYIRKEI